MSSQPRRGDVNTFLGQLLESLPLTQRLLRYRQLSQEALQKATITENDEMRAGYLSMAAGWHMLATEMERLRDRQSAAKDLPRGPGPVGEAEDRPPASGPGPTAQ